LERIGEHENRHTGIDCLPRNLYLSPSDLGLAFDGSTGTLDSVYKFLDTLHSPLFRYDDVLLCYSELVGKTGDIGRLEPRPGPPIPSQSEVNDQPRQRSESESDGFAWSPEEDSALLSGLEEYGWGNWADIRGSQRALRNRTARAINDRAIRLNLQKVEERQKKSAEAEEKTMDIRTEPLTRSRENPEQRRQEEEAMSEQLYAGRKQNQATPSQGVPKKPERIVCLDTAGGGNASPESFRYRKPESGRATEKSVPPPKSVKTEEQVKAEITEERALYEDWRDRFIASGLTFPEDPRMDKWDLLDEETRIRMIEKYTAKRWKQLEKGMSWYQVVLKYDEMARLYRSDCVFQGAGEAMDEYWEMLKRKKRGLSPIVPAEERPKKVGATQEEKRLLEEWKKRFIASGLTYPDLHPKERWRTMSAEQKKQDIEMLASERLRQLESGKIGREVEREYNLKANKYSPCIVYATAWTGRAATQRTLGMVWD
jgi:hypothetical protein